MGGTRRRVAGVLFVGVWAIALAAGFVGGVVFETTPGELGAAPPEWPDGSSLPRASDRPTLLLFAHPLCPCTRATLRELERVLARANAPLATTIVFSWDGPEPPADELGLQESVRALAGVAIAVDVGAHEARRFAAAVSGVAMLFASDGRRLFHGGITAARGHEGDNAGRDALLAALRGDASAPSTAPVFGCPLLDPAECGSCAGAPGASR